MGKIASQRDRVNRANYLAIRAVACPLCESPQMRACVNLAGEAMPTVHRERGIAYKASLRDVADIRSSVKPSGVVGSSTNAHPVDRVASRVTQHVAAFEKPLNERREAGLPALRPILKNELHNPDFTDLTGVMAGSLTVVGLSVERAARNKGALWVCRCSCGYYVYRTAKALKRDNPLLACEACCNRAQLIRAARRRAIFGATGCWPSD